MTRTTVGLPPAFEAFAAERYDATATHPLYDFDHRVDRRCTRGAPRLIRFGMFHLKNHLPDQRAILNDTTIDLMQRAVPPATYGLGWIVTEREGQRIVAHTGGMPGVQTVLAMYPTEDIAIVVLTNMVADIGRCVPRDRARAPAGLRRVTPRARVADSTAAAARAP